MRPESEAKISPFHLDKLNVLAESLVVSFFDIKGVLGAVSQLLLELVLASGYQTQELINLLDGKDQR